MASTARDLVVLAVHRRGADVTGETTLAAGDTLVVRGSWDALDRRASSRDLLIVDSPDLVRRRTAPLGTKAWTAIAITGAMVLLIATKALPEAVVGLLAGGTMIVLRIISMDQAFKAISWTTVILVAIAAAASRS